MSFVRIVACPGSKTRKEALEHIVEHSKEHVIKGPLTTPCLVVELSIDYLKQHAAPPFLSASSCTVFVVA